MLMMLRRCDLLESLLMVRRGDFRQVPVVAAGRCDLFRMMLCGELRSMGVSLRSGSFHQVILMLGARNGFGMPVTIRGGRIVTSRPKRMCGPGQRMPLFVMLAGDSVGAARRAMVQAKTLAPTCQSGLREWRTRVRFALWSVMCQIGGNMAPDEIRSHPPGTTIVEANMQPCALLGGNDNRRAVRSDPHPLISGTGSGANANPVALDTRAFVHRGSCPDRFRRIRDTNGTTLA